MGSPKTKKSWLFTNLFLLLTLAMFGMATPALAEQADPIEIQVVDALDASEESELVLGEPLVLQTEAEPSSDGDEPVGPAQKVNIADAQIQVLDQVYTGEELAATVTVSHGDEVLQENVDYTLSYEGDHTNAGQATVVVEGIGDRFEGTVQKSFTIAPKSIEPTMSLSESSYTYDGMKKTPEVVIYDGNKSLVKGTDYKLDFASGRKAVGAYSVTATLCGNYSGSVTKSFKIKARSVSSAKVGGVVAKTYTGKAIKQKPTVKMGSTVLKAKRDYTVVYKGNVNAGTAKVVVKGMGNYSGSVTKSFKISRRSVSSAKVGGVVAKTYTGKAIKQKLTVKMGSTVLKAKRDYTVVYKGNVNAGNAKVIVKGRGNYSGSVAKTFKIAKRDFAKAKVANVGKQLYTGKAIKPTPKVKWGKKTLVKGKDYTLSHKNNVHLGTASIVVKGKGNYSSASKSVSFAIYQQNVSGISVSSISTQSWTGSSITPNPSISWQGRTLAKGKDYTVSYSNNRYGGTASMTITGKGSFKGSKTVSFTIDGPKYKGVTVYITDTGEKYHNGGCRFLAYSSHAVDLGEAEWMGMTACKVCH